MGHRAGHDRFEALWRDYDSRFDEQVSTPLYWRGHAVFIPRFEEKPRPRNPSEAPGHDYST